MIAAILVAVAPWLGLGFSAQRQIILIAILAMIVSGLNLSFGFAGELALGQVFLYAAGAYTAGYLGSLGVTNILIVILAAAVVALIFGVVIGLAGLRLGGWMLALASLLVVGLIPNIANIFTAQLGGYAGMAGISRPTLWSVPFNNSAFYVLVIVCVSAWLLILRNLIKSREGASFLVLKESPVLAKTLGISVNRTKLRAYALGAVPAGVAGALYAYLDGYISPAVFTFDLGLVVLAASIIGGSQSIYGAIIGTAILQLGPQQLDVFQQYSGIAYGALLIVGGVLLGGGIAGLGHRLFNRVLAIAREDESRHAVEVLRPEVTSLHGQQLGVEGIVVRFGGFTALNGVSFVAKPGEVTALIGPNGSGKTTLLNVISGLLVPHEGVVRVGSLVSSGKSTFAAQHGIARTFQTPLVPSSQSVLEVAASGRMSTKPATLVDTVLRLPRYRKLHAADLAAARGALAAVGLAPLAETHAASLPLGTRRLLEFARSLASRPSVLLLDEVASGLDENELRESANLIRAVRDAGATVVLVEHNFELVREISDRVVVLAEGEILAEGDAEVVARDEKVINLYLGADVLHNRPAAAAASTGNE
ncbi:branched-chain amino acid ABC transporter ATP-binding protein/permease [Glaciibacter sp. 2TAF33]|uniref:branched-chain amino acid ABC transporter ATP-binding protein/permease n=1 Tax=Glaciibacter sp. 2TAF33 TaxID=3233015 RepID=UPI003F92709D